MAHFGPGLSAQARTREQDATKGTKALPDSDPGYEGQSASTFTLKLRPKVRPESNLRAFRTTSPLTLSQVRVHFSVGLTGFEPATP